MRPEELPTDQEMLRLQCLAYTAAHVVLTVRRDPSIKQPVEEEELGFHLLALADQVITEHGGALARSDIVTLYPLMRGAWEADKQVGTEIGVG